MLLIKKYWQIVKIGKLRVISSMSMDLMGSLRGGMTMADCGTKIIRVTTDNNLEIYDFFEGTVQEQNEYLCKLIGNGCSCYELVHARRFCYGVMLVDDEGALKENEYNPIGSYLYGTDIHGSPIMGNVLLVGLSGDRTDIVGFDLHILFHVISFLVEGEKEK